MTGITHQMIAIVSAFWLLTLYPTSVGPYVGVLAIVAVMIGALTPDIDQPTANIWHRLLGGWAVGKVFRTVSGGHRHITHSVLGLFIIGWLLWQGFHRFIQPAYVPAMNNVWIAFMVGYISHLVADTLTDRGVPWLWPIPWSIKIPPGPEELRVTTGSIVEMVLLRLALVIAFGFLVYSHWPTLALFFK